MPRTSDAAPCVQERLAATNETCFARTEAKDVHGSVRAPISGRSSMAIGLMRFSMLVVAATCACNIASAEDYPSRPVRVMVGFSPGTTADITARVVGQRIGQNLGQQMVVENKAGAGSSFAAEAVARAPKDGYTLLIASIANPINAVVSSNLSFDFPKDFAPILRLTTTHNILGAPPTTGAHRSGELLKGMAGVAMVHVPYGGIPQAVTDLLAGRIQVLFSPASTV